MNFGDSDVECGSCVPEAHGTEGARGINDLVAVEVVGFIICGGHVEIVAEIAGSGRGMVDAEEVEAAALDHEGATGEAGAGECPGEHS